MNKTIEMLPNAGSLGGDVLNATDLREVMPGILAKFECNNPAGSHKVRAARYIVESALKVGDIVPGKTTVIEKTGGNFGFGLAVACHPISVGVELAVGLNFSPVKRRCLELFGARLIGIDLLRQGATPREVVEWHIEHAAHLGRSYFYADQFNNPASVAAHEFETGPEIVFQLAAWPKVRKLTFVACAGTGASLTGIARALISAGFEVNTVLVEPAGCDSRSGVFVDHRLEGMSVGVALPFLDWSLIQDTRTVTYEDAMAIQQGFGKRTGFFIGNTTAACLAVAVTLAAPLSEHTQGVDHYVRPRALVYVRPAGALTMAQRKAATPTHESPVSERALRNLETSGQATLETFLRVAPALGRTADLEGILEIKIHSIRAMEEARRQTKDAGEM